MEQTSTSLPRAPGLYHERFGLIDAWRGLAALAVVVHHVAGSVLGGPAVIVFFVISGYCIAASADSCARKGLGWREFMWRRVRRIYPPYLFSLAFWAATRVLKIRMGGENDLARTPLEWIQNLTLTQWLTLVVHPQPSATMNPTPFVSVYWSLCYEEQFYLVMGLLLVVCSGRRGPIGQAVVALTLVGLVWNVLAPQLATGIFLEYWALFGIGALVFYRLCRVERAGLRRAIDIFLAVLMLVSAYLRWFAGIEWQGLGHYAPLWSDYRIAWGEMIVGSAFALSLIVCRRFDAAYAATRIAKLLGALGAITFSLYLVHQFNLVLVETAVERGWSIVARFTGLPLPEWLSQTLQCAGHIGIASVFWFFCERPFLNKSLLDKGVPKPSPQAMPAAIPSA